MSLEQKRELIRPGFEGMSISKQCKSLGLMRSSYYFKPRGESLYNEQLMKLIDGRFLEHPETGVCRMTDWLNLDMGHHVNTKRVRRLYKVMNLRTLFPKKNLSKARSGDHKYPYLLNGLVIDRPNQVWQADITYIPMYRGFMYLFAIIDVYSRKIMGWSTSNTMSVEWCRDVLKDTLREHGSPEIFNTDQGSQFTSPKFINVLKDNQVSISMDGKGRALDNVYIERFWWALKHEEIYLNPPNGGIELYRNVKRYVEYYNNERRHTSIGKQTPNRKFNDNSKKVS